MIYFSKKVCFFFCLFSFLSFSFPSQESIVPIFDLCKDRSFELVGSGADSFVLKINSLEEFDKELLESKVPTIVVFYSVLSNKNLNFKENIFQVAAELQGKVSFLSVEINENIDLMSKLKVDFLNLFNEKDQVPSQADFLEFFQYFSSSCEEQSDLVPFFLFFKGDLLVIPQNYKFETKDILIGDINKFLLAPDPLVNKNLKEKIQTSVDIKSKDIQNSSTNSWWGKVKDSTSKLKDGFLNFINRLNK